jgi:hypothetical protein
MSDSEEIYENLENFSQAKSASSQASCSNESEPPSSQKQRRFLLFLNF